MIVLNNTLLLIFKLLTLWENMYCNKNGNLQ